MRSTSTLMAKVSAPVLRAISVIVCTMCWICTSRVLVVRAVLALRCATWP